MNKPLTPETCERILHLRGTTDLSLVAIGLEVGCSKTAASVVCNPSIRQRHSERAKIRRHSTPKSPLKPRVVWRGEADRDAAARLAEVPIDTRTELQRMMGEPMKERSALYRKQTGGEA